MDIRVLPPKTTFRIICKKCPLDPRFPYPNYSCVPNFGSPPPKMCSGGGCQSSQKCNFRGSLIWLGGVISSSYFFLIYFVTRSRAPISRIFLQMKIGGSRDTYFFTGVRTCFSNRVAYCSPPQVVNFQFLKNPQNGCPEARFLVAK